MTSSMLSWAGVLSRKTSPHSPRRATFPLASFASSVWFFLRRRSRVVLDLEHRMVARYLGVGGPSSGGNHCWDLAEFSEVVLARRQRRRLLTGFGAGAWLVCLRRPDGSDLELYCSRDAEEAAAVAARAAYFAGLPHVRRVLP